MIKKQSSPPWAPHKCLHVFLQAPPSCVWVLIILSLFCFPGLKMVALSCSYYLWFLSVFPLYVLRLPTLVLNNSSVYNVINWFFILLTGLWKVYHYDQIDLYPYRCFPFLFYFQLNILFLTNDYFHIRRTWKMII